MTRDYAYIDDDGYYLVSEGGDGNQHEIFQFGNLLLITGVCLLVILLLSLCYTFCARDRDTRLFDCDTGRKIIAREVRPGLVVIQNCQDSDETLQMLQNCETTETDMPLQHFQQYGGVTEQTSSNSTTETYIQSGGPSHFSNVRSQKIPESATSETLIDIDMEENCKLSSSRRQESPVGSTDDSKSNLLISIS